MTRLASLTAGQTVQAGYRNWLNSNEFLGFSDNVEKYSRTPAFNSLKDLKAAKGAKNAADLVALQDAAGEYGHGFYALFRDLEGDYVWGAYLYNGRWSVGTSGDALKLA
jgi:hypothetical protein